MACRLLACNDEDKGPKLRDIHAKSPPGQSGQPKRTKKNPVGGFWVPPWLAEFCGACVLPRNINTLGTTGLPSHTDLMLLRPAVTACALTRLTETCVVVTRLGF